MRSKVVEGGEFEMELQESRYSAAKNKNVATEGRQIK
jgi:hypothetical protein